MTAVSAKLNRGFNTDSTNAAIKKPIIALPTIEIAKLPILTPDQDCKYGIFVDSMVLYGAGPCQANAKNYIKTALYYTVQHTAPHLAYHMHQRMSPPCVTVREG